MTAAEAVPALATVNGTPFQQLPEDLYIPPDALEVCLDMFSGPLDLLLYLIRRQNLDILDIPVAQITRQYMAYIQMLGGLKIELAADYLVMAAWLAEIKSRMLLPRPAEAEAEEEDPRATLVRRLQEYETLKLAAESLERLPRVERDLFLVELAAACPETARKPPEVEWGDVLKAFQAVLKRAEHLTHHAITKEALSVRERMSNILASLKGTSGRAFTELFSYHEGRHGVVVTFLAILELAKEGLVEIHQTNPFADIHVCAVTDAGGE